MKHDGLPARLFRLIRPPQRIGPFEPYGIAVQDHFAHGRPRRFYIHDLKGTCIKHSSIEAFSPILRMQLIEESALSLARGRVLDVGAGTGRHSLLLGAKGLEVVPVDTERRCVEVMHRRGLSTARCADIFDLDDGPFDTILALQHTIGLVGTVERLVQLLAHFRGILAPKGQILVDSTAPIYPASSPFYAGQRELELWYGRYVGERFLWLYADFNLLRGCARLAGLDAELITQGQNSRDYLARMANPSDDA